MSEELVQRLEAVVNKLDKSGGDGGDGPPPALTAWDQFHESKVVAFINATAAIPELKKVADWTTTAFDHTRVVLQASVVSAKPTDEEYIKFLDPIVQVITASGNPNNRDPFFPHEKSFAEIIQALSWLMVPGTAQHVNGQLEAADFYLNKVLTGCKDKGDDEKKKHREYVKTLKEMMKSMAEYCTEWYKTGLVWKFNGAKLSEYKPGDGASAAKSDGKKSVDERLEALAIRLEKVAAKLGGGGDGDTPAYLAEYDTFYTEKVAPFVAACGKIPELKDIGQGYETAYKFQRTVLQAQAESKKPTDEDFLKFLKPIVDVITASGNCDNRSPIFNHQKVYNETIQALSWLMMPGGKAFIDGQGEASQMYLNKILMTAKDLEDPLKTNHREFVKTNKELMKGLSDFTQEWFKMGLTWNVKGGDLNAWKPKA